jgi:hypothetical protein
VLIESDAEAAMRKLLGILTASTILGISGATYACDDLAYDDSFAQMTKPTQNASVAKATPEAQRVAQRPDKRTARVKQPVAVKVAAMPAASKCDGGSCD